MKTGAILRSAIGILVLLFLVSGSSFSTRTVHAREDGYNEPSKNYTREELAQMLAPIAIYPDPLLSQVLMASTYPIEIVEADRWVRKNPRLGSEALDQALLKKDWAPSVKAICHFPEVLAVMSERIADTTQIGNAFLVQEADVMNMVQELRAKAHAEGNLETTSNRKVIIEKETIIIEPRNPRIIFVPYYDPYHVYGSWWHPAYPPYCWWPHRFFIGYGVSYWPAYRFNFSFGYWSRIDWRRRHIFIDAHKRPKFARHDRWKKKPGRWHHASHKRGVVYRNKSNFGGYEHFDRGAKGIRQGFRKYPEPIDRHFDNRRNFKQIGGNSNSRDRVERPDRNREGRVRFERLDRNRDRRDRVERLDRNRDRRVRFERLDRKSRNRGGDRNRVGKEKHFRGHFGTVNSSDLGRPRVESGKRDHGGAFERFGKSGIRNWSDNFRNGKSYRYGGGRENHSGRKHGGR